MVQMPARSNQEDYQQTGLGMDHVLLFVILLVLRLSVWDHAIPVHGDEEQFIQALGFPANYPVHQPGYPAWVCTG
jgi:hypothetical protein